MKYYKIQIGCRPGDTDLKLDQQNGVTWDIRLLRETDSHPLIFQKQKAKFDSTLQNPSLTVNYVSESGISIENCGFSFKVNMSRQSDIKGGPLESTYKLEQFHLHWGSCDSQGSEHTIDGKKYAAELHLVHWNSTKYQSFGDAVNKPDGLAVFGIMLDVGPEYAGFKQISDLIEKLNKLRSLIASDDCAMGCPSNCIVDNYRSPLDLGNRELRASFAAQE
ncbi:hypothetical protein KUTeg_018878 [Tegillarca granosa]|uniref:Carbonic anhydrase n=1 Tax=Tegillarca granosa TaxID=220873 RepID=A0ABQ9EAX5_TEGGR|nr:hypothetical protein KUTeg_018878 [Tegillarca granosa]